MAQCKSVHNKGFTLIEVLIALVILAIALTAVLALVSKELRSQAHIQQSMTANWVAEQVIAEARLDVLDFNATPVQQGDINMLNHKWYWQAASSNNALLGVRQVKVSVGLANKALNLATWYGFLNE